MVDHGSDRRGPAGSMIGRDADLELIGSFLERAASGGGALLMSGEAGVGKTLLLETVAARAAAPAGTLRRAFLHDDRWGVRSWTGPV